MEPISLENLIPKTSSFTLKSTGQTFETRPMNLSDEIWIKNELKSDFDRVMKNPEHLARLAYRLLTEESKDLLVKKKVTFKDEQGDQFEKVIGGVNLLICSIQGVSEVVAVQKAVLASFGIDDEMLKDLSESAQKKTLPPNQSTGEKSSTPSQLNTDGRPNTFYREPGEKLLGDLSA